jgi:hypothetical protein
VLMVRTTKGSAPVTATAPEAVTPREAAAAPRAPKGRVTGFEPIVTPTEAEARTAAAAQLQAAVTEATATAMGATVETDDASKSRFRFAKKRDPSDGTAKEKRSMFGRRSEPAEAAAADAPAVGDASATALQREIAIRQALEDQLEQLRTRVKTQQDEGTTATRELTEQLDAAVRRAEDAEAELELASGGVAGAATAGAAEVAAAAARIRALEQELVQTRTAAAEARARSDQLEAAQAAEPTDPAADQKRTELTAQLADAQQRAASAEQRASAAEQRAASVESVRDELEVKVAQLGAKAGEFERRAAELEGTVREANAGGDAVRAEIATLTAALAAANARVQELEAVTTTPTPAADHEAEITRLRGELAKQLERAQAAEDRIASLEADVLAAERGLRSLAADVMPKTAEPEAVPPAPSDEDRYDEMWSAPSVAAAASVENGGDPNTGADPGAQGTAGGAADEPEPAAEDMWSLRARLAEAAARKQREIP